MLALWKWIRLLPPIYFISSKGKHNYEEQGINSWKLNWFELEASCGGTKLCRAARLFRLQSDSCYQNPRCLVVNPEQVPCVRVGFWKELVLFLLHALCWPASPDYYFFSLRDCLGESIPRV